jgi:hypothetical protein
MHFELTGEEQDVDSIRTYLDFIKFCQQAEGHFLNYADKDKRFTEQNEATNLADANGRAIWALGYLIANSKLLPPDLANDAIELFDLAIRNVKNIHSTRSMAFIIKGLYFYRQAVNSPKNLDLIHVFANRMVKMYRMESSENWEWFEGYLSCANSVLPEAMLYAWLLTSHKEYKDIAISSFGFLLSRTFNENGIEVISNKKWLMKGREAEQPSVGGEQPIDVAYTIMTLSKFHNVFVDKDYKDKMEAAFSWFLGNNRLHQIVYNPCTGGCYDGLEEFHVNLNQGAESTLSYLMARLTIESSRNKENPVKTHVHVSSLVLKSE